jgi:hypothetical protein
MELPSFVWAENVFDAPGSSIGGELESLAAAKARVVFTSNLPENRLLTYQGNSQRPPIRLYGQVASDGEVVDRNGFAPRLLANDDELSVSGIQWSRTIMVPSAMGTLTMLPLTFHAALDGETVGPTTATLVSPSEPIPGEDPVIIDGGAP